MGGYSAVSGLGRGGSALAGVVSGLGSSRIFCMERHVRFASTLVVDTVSHLGKVLQRDATFQFKGRGQFLAFHREVNWEDCEFF